jgi:hypothetical protein
MANESHPLVWFLHKVTVVRGYIIFGNSSICEKRNLLWFILTLIICSRGLEQEFIPLVSFGSIVDLYFLIPQSQPSAQPSLLIDLLLRTWHHPPELLPHLTRTFCSVTESKMETKAMGMPAPKQEGSNHAVLQSAFSAKTSLEVYMKLWATVAIEFSLILNHVRSTSNNLIIL